MPQTRTRRGIAHLLRLIVALTLSLLAAPAVGAATPSDAAVAPSPSLHLVPDSGAAGTSFIATASGFGRCTTGDTGTQDGVSPQSAAPSSPPPGSPLLITPLIPAPLKPAARLPKATPSLTALERPLVGAAGFVEFLWDGVKLGESVVNLSDGTAQATVLVPDTSGALVHHVDAQCVENPKLAAGPARFTVTLAPPPPVMTVVPNLLGDTHDTAEATLRSHHLTLGTTTGDGDRVQGQHPAAGTRVDPGTAVSLAFGAALSHTSSPEKPTPWVAVAAGCALLLALLLAGLAGYRAHRSRSSRRWLRAHVKVVAAQTQDRPSITVQRRDDGSPPTTVVTLESHVDAGTQVVEETTV
jgi:hypothetical protein